MYQENPYDFTAHPHYQQPASNQPSSSSHTSGMAVAALILGIFSLITCCCGIGGIIFGSAGIIIAILSRGTHPMEKTAKLGLGFSIAGLILGLVLLVFLFFSSNFVDDFSYYYNYYSNEPAPELPFDDHSLDDLIENYSIHDLSC